MPGIEILLISLLVVFAQGTNSSEFSNWQSSWIIGGRDAVRGEFKYMACLRDSGNNNHICGGSIINRWYILTAAHCVEGRAPSSVVVVVGNYKLSLRGHRYPVRRYITHPGYDPANFRNDISLLKLERFIIFSAVLMPIELPQQDQISSAESVCTFTGWGKTSADALFYPNHLQRVQLKITSLTECRSFYPFVSNLYVCADAGPGKGTTEGDAGGPLVCANRQVGVYIRGGRRRSTVSTPYTSLFVNVPKYVNWIRQNSN